MNILNHVEPIFRMTSTYREEKRIVYDGVLKMADNVMDEMSRKSLDSSERDDDFGSKPKTFIRALTNRRNGLAIDEIKEEINTFIAAVSFCCWSSIHKINI